jgi:hypothetical protein
VIRTDPSGRIIRSDPQSARQQSVRGPQFNRTAIEADDARRAVACVHGDGQCVNHRAVEHREWETE